jgi:hypothetical protein
MEQPCHKCGKAVEEGIAFCPHCTAPQIRVVLAEPLPVALPPADSSAATQGSSALATSQADIALPLRGGHILKPCALAALASAVLLLLGLNVFVAMLGAGFLAVVLYRQRLADGTMSAGAGARVGALSGMLFFAFTVLFLGLTSLIPEFRAKFQQQFIEGAEKWAASRPSDPQIQAALEQLKTPQGLVMALIFGAVLLFVLSVLLGTLGGALAGNILGRRNKT